jgi:two-component system response regulator PilR (NtrC family)
MMERIASTTSNVLVIGESGTGKELVARQLHDWSDRAKKSFVAVNCGAIPENLIESELFGHKRGSFTGAVADKPGLFEVASGGTLFLDEIGELPLSMQVKLLRAIQSRTIRRVGGNEDQKIDVRLIAATNRNLEKMVADGTFREDLYYRLNVLMLTTPPLRERPEDIPILVEHFFKKCAAKFGKELQGVTPEAMRALEAYSWPGNVRELENQVERAVALETETKIRRESFLIGSTGESAPRREVSFTFVPGEEELESLLKRFREFVVALQRPR